MDRVRGKVAIITGAARGMGASHAKLLASEGANVVVTDILEDEGRAVAREIGNSAKFVRHDVASQQDWKHVIQETEAAFGPASILVNNAGASPTLPISDLSEATFRKVFEVNQLGVFLGMQAVAPSMMSAGGGSIVNISSVAGLVGFPHLNAYNGAKFAVRGMTKGAALEFAPHRIRVNSVHPGSIDTPALAQALGGDEEARRRMEEGVPLKRIADPVEVSYLVLFLASDEASYCTGAEFVVDGGLTCQ